MKLLSGLVFSGWALQLDGAAQLLKKQPEKNLKRQNLKQNLKGRNRTILKPPIILDEHRQQKQSTMAAFRKLSNSLIFSSPLSKSNSNIVSPSSVVPALLILSRGIASKLFVGGMYLENGQEILSTPSFFFFFFSFSSFNFSRVIRFM